MLRRSFLCRFVGILGGFIGLGVESVMADVPVPCPECGKASMPRRQYKNATEYVCLNCAANGDLPLIAYTFTRKGNDPNYYAFFPADIEAAFRPSRREATGTGWSLMQDYHGIA
jgi:predicted RNA-binding Zn-ribbon protein involved in translation (DUF1610 family)